MPKKAVVVEPKKRHSNACRWFWEWPFKCALCNEEFNKISQLTDSRS